MAGVIPSTGALIWISVKPMFRIILPGSAGFILTKMGSFPAAGPKIASVLILNLTLPALLFAKVVPSFNSDNISALGPIILVAFIYQAANFVMAVIVRATCQTPRKFRYGFLSAFTFSNWGDLPTAASQAIASQLPFNGVADENLAIAYISIFILVNFISLFPLQGIRLVKMDYTSKIDAEREDKLERAGGWAKWRNRLWQGKPMRLEWGEEGLAVASEADAKNKGKGKEGEKAADVLVTPRAMPPALSTSRSRSSRNTTSPALEPTLSRRSTRNPDEDFPHTTPTPSLLPVESRADEESPHPHVALRVLRSVLSFLNELNTPPTTTLLAALIIALVPTLKSLFVANSSDWHPVAPDGLPPLAIIYDTASFVGAASVPLGLVVLGASMAKMVLPRPIVRLPIAGIAWMAICKLVILPLIGFGMMQGLVKHTGMVSADNKVLRFVLVYFSCVPTATSQIAYTQVFGPDDGDNNADLLAAYLIAQYTVYVFASVLLTAITLNTIF